MQRRVSEESKGKAFSMEAFISVRVSCYLPLHSNNF